MLNINQNEEIVEEFATEMKIDRNWLRYKET